MSEYDALLVQRAKQGDPDAYQEIYDECYPKLYSYIYYRVGGDHALAEDITSEVFVRLVRSIGKYQYKGRPILAFLYTIAGNLVRDHYRKANRITLVEIDDREIVSDEDPTEPLDLSMLSENLVGAISHLTEEQAQVIIFKFVEGKTNAEVADLMDKREGSIKSLQHRALAALRRTLSKMPQFDELKNKTDGQ